MAPRPDPIPILMYHQVTPRPHPAFKKYSVTPAAFATQMSWLAWVGYHPVTLDAVLDARAGKGSLPRWPVVLTFDDGFRECWDHALPVLLARGFVAVFFLVAGLVGGRSSWLLRERGVEFPLMDWTAVRALLALGCECGAHTMSHPRLARLSAPACQEELRCARLLLEERLHRPVRHLAYPFGSYDERVRALAQETGYRSACSVRVGLSPQDDDPFALHRVPILGTDSIADFAVRLRTAHPAGEVVRGLTSGLRRRLAAARGPRA